MAILGIHVVWTLYGTWLPGSSHGHWSPLFDFYGHLIKAGGQLNLPDETSRQYALASLKEPPKLLDDDEMYVLDQKIGEHLTWPDAEMGTDRKPRAYAAAFEPNHVHLLFGPVDEDLDRFVGRLKGTSSSAILKMPGNESRSRTWTSKFWRVFLFNEVAFAAVKKYIENHNRRKNERAAPFLWISPL